MGFKWAAHMGPILACHGRPTGPHLGPKWVNPMGPTWAQPDGIYMGPTWGPYGAKVGMGRPLGPQFGWLVESVRLQHDMETTRHCPEPVHMTSKSVSQVVNFTIDRPTAYTRPSSILLKTCPQGYLGHWKRWWQYRADNFKGFEVIASGIFNVSISAGFVNLR